MVATEVGLMEYVIAPPAGIEDVAVHVQGAELPTSQEYGPSANVNVGTGSAAMIVRAYVAVADPFAPDFAACDAVTVAEPALTGVTIPVLASMVATAVLLIVYVINPPEEIDDVATFEHRVVLPTWHVSVALTNVSTGTGSGLSDVHE
jgi:hypothetical protein